MKTKIRALYAESGSGSIMALVCILVLSVLVFTFLGYFKMHQIAARTQIAADLASLAGADVVYGFAGGVDFGRSVRGGSPACRAAEAVARANKIVLSDCYVRDGIVHVASKTRLGIFEINIVSKAGL